MSFPHAVENESNEVDVNSRTHRVIEMFAGVGGFHHGLEQVNQQRLADGQPKAFEVVWASQWEPGCKKQRAAQVYAARWGHVPVSRDIFKVLEDPEELARIAALAPTILVGGFPCQDYSVARPAPKSEGLVGKKGTLWWAIHRLLAIRRAAGQPIEQVLLENVDRLINSPTACRGRDFAIILSSLNDLGYAVSWQVVNAADYGFAQRRRRVFMVAVHESTEEFRSWERNLSDRPTCWLTTLAPLARALPIDLKSAVVTFDLGGSVLETQASYQPTAAGKSRFGKVGVCIRGKVVTAAARATVIADYSAFTGKFAATTLGDVVSGTIDVPPAFYLDEPTIARWAEAKGAKSVARVAASGFAYTFSEGAMPFPDPLDRPCRTVITSEGGRAVARTKHVIRDATGQLRRLTPDELDELTGFPRGFTALAGVSDAQRAFLMGNALVTGVVARIGAAMADSL